MLLMALPKANFAYVTPQTYVLSPRATRIPFPHSMSHVASIESV